MEYNTKEYLEKVESVYENYIKKQVTLPDENPGLRPEIYESWKRSQSNYIDPNFRDDYRADNERFKKILSDNEYLLETATPYMENIYDFVRERNFLIHIADKDGCIMKIFSDNTKICDLFRKIAKLEEGSIRNENIYGTNSTSLCLSLGEPVQVMGPEHYLEYNHVFFCSASPIKDSEGKVLGAITIMGPQELYQNHTLGITSTATHAIELELQRQEYYHKLTATNHLLSVAIEGMRSGIAVLNNKHEILEYNNNFMKIFELPPSDDYHMRDFFSIIDKNSIPQNMRQFNESVTGVPLSVSTGSGITSDVLVTFDPIKTEGDELSMILLRFAEQKDVNSLVSKISNFNATYNFDSIIGESKSLTDIKRIAKKISKSESNVLIISESGTGKELLAQAIHNSSDRKNNPFVTINCGSIPRNLIESELFGYEDGAFTGAKPGGHPGKFELANQGTLFLDEIGDMPIELQASLLRVLQFQEVTRLGSTYPRKVDVRIIAATNTDLVKSVSDKTFRTDLYYRLNVLSLELPALRDRKEDIPLLVDKFIEIYSNSLKRKPCTISDKALSLLCGYKWPGNVRELENVIERAINIMPDSIIKPEHLPDNITKVDRIGNVVNIDVNSITEDHEPALRSAPEEREYIIDLLTEENGCVNTVARRLDIPKSTLYRKLKKYNISAKKFKYI